MSKERILTYNEIDREEWRRLVATSATGTWFQTPEAYCFYKSLPDLFRPFVVGLAYPRPLPKGKGEKPNPDPSLKGREDTAQVSFAAVWGAHTADSTQYDLLEANARENRKNPTEAENVLWGLLKGNNIGLHFRRQHVILDYIVDFICLEKGLVIELDGGYHNDIQQKEYDEQRTAYLQKLGYTELRFTNEELLVNPEGVIARIKSVASSLPSLQGRTEDRLVLRGVCVGYVTREKNPLKQFFTRRAIIIGGPALADDACSEEVELLMKAVREQPILNPSLEGRTSNPPSLQDEGLRPIERPVDGHRTSLGERLLPPIYIETRNFNDYSRWKDAFAAAGFEYRPHLNFHVDCTDKEKMWERLSDTRKKQIRRVRNERVNELTNEGIKEQEIREWYKILERLYKTKVKTPLWPVEFFLEAYRQGIGKYLMVKHEGKVIGGLMMVEWKKGVKSEELRVKSEGVKELTNEGIKELKSEEIRDKSEGTVYEWFECGLNAEYKEQYPAVMATWAGMEYAAEHNIPRCDFMGAGEPGVPYGVRDFKEKFGGELVEHGRFLYIAKPMLYKIGTIGVRLLKKLT